MKPTKAFILATSLATFLLSAACQASPYRESEPPTLPQPRPAAVKNDSDQLIQQFRNAYIAAGKPRIALFWNVALTDTATDQKASRTSIQGGTTRNWNALDKTTAGEAGSATMREGNEESTTNMTITTGDVIANNDKPRIPFAESDAWKLETAFATAMRAGNVRFIDRSAIIRTTHVQQGKDATSDTRTLETMALLGKADMLMEVLIAKDSTAPLGWGFRVSLKDINSGTQLASFYSRAEPDLGPAPQPYFVATDKGFEKVTPQQMTASVEDIGRALARDTMRDLQNTLPPMPTPMPAKVSSSKSKQ